MRLGLVGYGVGGRYFHAPFIQAADGLELAGVVTRDPQRRAELGQDYPGVPVYDSQHALLDAGVDIVTITTPPPTRRELVLEAIAVGVHIVADKPFAPTAAAARELAEAAQSAGVVLTVFHNRRWDADIRTLRATLGRLGHLQRIESRFDLDQPGLLETGPFGGLLRDLGSHLVDQMLWLLGPAASVHATLDWTDFPDGRTDSAFDITLTHLSGVRSRVSSTKLNRLDDRELRAYGTAGAYICHSTDVQARASLAGKRPADLGDAWGYEPPESWGVLSTADGVVTVPSERGAYQDYYSGFVSALRGEGPVPVPVHEAIGTLAVLDAARTSAAQGRVVELHGLWRRRLTVRGGAGAADHQAGFQDGVGATRDEAFEAVDGSADRRPGQHRRFLADRCQVNRVQLCDRRVVVPGDRAVAGYPYSRLGQHVHDAQGAVVVERAHGGGQLLVPQQSGGSAAAVAFGFAAGDYPCAVAQAADPHRGPVTLSPLGRDGLAAAVDVDDVTMAEPGQMADDERQAAVVGGTHHVDVVKVHPASHQDERQLVSQLAQARLGQLGAEQDRGLAAEAEECPDGAALVVRGGDQGRHDLVTGLSRRCLDVLYQLGLEGAADVHGDA
jgi:predicted dehydrogenase